MSSKGGKGGGGGELASELVALAWGQRRASREVQELDRTAKPDEDANLDDLLRHC